MPFQSSQYRLIEADSIASDFHEKLVRMKSEVYSLDDYSAMTQAPTVY